MKNQLSIHSKKFAVFPGWPVPVTKFQPLFAANGEKGLADLKMPRF